MGTPNFSGKILLFSYAFPPMQVQMTPAVFKPMMAFTDLGCEVDVVCADSFSPVLSLDNSLLPLAEQKFNRIIRLNPATGFRGNIYKVVKAFGRIPDLMTVLHHTAYECLMDMNLQQYDAVVTWSPFHSINAVMTRVCRARPTVRWLAQFSDPWRDNPLEVNPYCKMWNVLNEPRATATAHHIVHSSRYSLELMLRNNPQLNLDKTSVLPHVFNESLYPERPKKSNEFITLRYLGVLYGRRSPLPLFEALTLILKRRPEFVDRIRLEIVGHMPQEWLGSREAQSLPVGILTNIPNVDYLQSLELMYDADVLLLIEANVRNNLFLPSKLSDYVGAQTPIVGIVSPGASTDALRDLGHLYARPNDVTGIADALEETLNARLSVVPATESNVSAREAIRSTSVANKFIETIKRLA